MRHPLSIRSGLAAVALSLACAKAPMRSADNIAWSGFVWAPVQAGGAVLARGAVLLPVVLDGAPGRTYFLQLDTGAGWPQWYEVPLRRVLPNALRDGPAQDELVLRGSVGGYSLRADTFAIRKSFGDVPGRVRPIIGTLGLRFFRGRVLLLDFPRQRFAILDSAQRLPQHITDNASFVPITYRNGHAFIPLRLGSQFVNDFFYDSGASLFPFTTPPELWRTLTGRTGNEGNNTRWRVSSWGKSLEMIGAPLAAGSPFVADVGMYNCHHLTDPP